jgi:hypothetical protein
MVILGRRLPEMMVKTAALHVACIYAFGHLLGLQAHTVRNQRNMVISCLLFPLLPAALLIRDVADSIMTIVEHRFRRSRPQAIFDADYYLSGALGMQVQQSRPGQGQACHILSCKDANIVQKVREEYDWRWAARVLFWVLFTAQATMSFALLVRRIMLSTDHDEDDLGNLEEEPFIWWENQIGRFADCPLDHLNGAVAFGGIATGLSVFGILLLNSRWEQTALLTTNAARERDAGAAVRMLHFTALGDLLLLARTSRTWYYPTTMLRIMSALGYPKDHPQNAFSRILLSWNLFCNAILPVGCIYILYLSVFSVTRLRSTRFDESNPFILRGTIKSYPLILGSLKGFFLLDLPQLLFVYDDCIHYGESSCPTPFWFWKDPLSDQLYAL